MSFDAGSITGTIELVTAPGHKALAGFSTALGQFKTNADRAFSGADLSARWSQSMSQMKIASSQVGKAWTDVKSEGVKQLAEIGAAWQLTLQTAMAKSIGASGQSMKTVLAEKLGSVKGAIGSRLNDAWTNSGLATAYTAGTQHAQAYWSASESAMKSGASRVQAAVGSAYARVGDFSRDIMARMSTQAAAARAAMSGVWDKVMAVPQIAGAVGWGSGLIASARGVVTRLRVELAPIAGLWSGVIQSAVARMSGPSSQLVQKIFSLGQSATSAITTVVRGMGGPITIAAVAVVGAVFAAVGTASAIAWHEIHAKMNDMAAKGKAAMSVGVDVSSFQLMMHTSRMDAGELASSIKMLENNLMDAVSAAGPAKDTLSQLGLKAIDLVNMPVDQTIGKISDALNKIPNAYERTNVAMNLFGRQAGPELMAFLAKGSEAMAKSAEHAKHLGYVFTEFDLEKIKQARKSLGELGEFTEGPLTRATIKAAPYVKFLADTITDWGVRSKTSIADVATTLLKIASPKFAWFSFLKDSTPAQWFFAKIEADANAAAKATIDAANKMNGAFKLQPTAEQLKTVNDSLESLQKNVRQLKMDEIDKLYDDFVRLPGVTSKLNEFNKSLAELRQLTAQKLTLEFFSGLDRAVSGFGKNDLEAQLDDLRARRKQIADEQRGLVAEINKIPLGIANQEQIGKRQNLQGKVNQNQLDLSSIPEKINAIFDAQNQLRIKTQLKSVNDAIFSFQTEINQFNMDEFARRWNDFVNLPGAAMFTDQIDQMIKKIRELKNLQSEKAIKDMQKENAQFGMTDLQRRYDDAKRSPLFKEGDQLNRLRAQLDVFRSKEIKQTIEDADPSKRWAKRLEELDRLHKTLDPNRGDKLKYLLSDDEYKKAKGLAHKEIFGDAPKLAGLYVKGSQADYQARTAWKEHNRADGKTTNIPHDQLQEAKKQSLYLKEIASRHAKGDYRKELIFQ